MNAVAEKNLSRIQREKRGKIQKAALEVFSEYGLRSATLDKIATACGLTKPNILYYYSSKDQIYFENNSTMWYIMNMWYNITIRGFIYILVHYTYYCIILSFKNVY